jgi:type I restriction enzyme S subunit
MEHVEAHSMKLLGTVPAATMKSSAVHFRPGDVLYGRLRPYLNKVYRPTFEGLCSAEFIVLPENERVDGGYLQYFLNSPAFVRYASHLNTGDRPRVDFDQLATYEIPLPAVDEQRRIVAELEKQFSRLDEAVANLKRGKANLRRQRAAVLGAAVAGTLLGDRRRAEWIDTTIGDVGQVISGLTKNPKREGLPRKLPYLRVANVYADELRLDQIEYIGVADHELDKLLVRQGDMLIVEGNGSPDQIGRVALWDGSIENCVHQNHLIRVRLGSRVTPQWALTWLLSPGGRHEIESVSSSTSGLHTLSTGKVARLPIPVPPVPEQHRIVAEVDRRLSIVREVEAEVDANLKRAQGLRQAVLAKAFSEGGIEQPLPSEQRQPLQLIPGTTTPADSVRAVISAEIVHRLHQEPTFGHVKHQKIIYLIEHIARIESMQTRYRREKFGPVNLQTLEANERVLEQQGWYAHRLREGSKGHRYVPMTKAGGHAGYLWALSPKQLTQVRDLIALMRDWDTDRCERFATVYAAWNDLILLGKPVTPDAVLSEILDLWDQGKKRFTRAQWLETMHWIEKGAFSPTGFGQLTRPAIAGVTPSLLSE